jgi:orotate phosphoribosyltransferase
MNQILKLILDSKALSIWNHKTGPVFWYAAGVPGPFYLNTELMIGRALSEKLLEQITAIVASGSDSKVRAEQLHTLIMDAYKNHANYRTVVQAMIGQARHDFHMGSATAVSGGERRDWLFSIPFAEELGLKHIYLFKDQSVYCSQSLTKGEKVLHVSDLINNAASYFDLWLPSLGKAGLVCAGTLTVNTRGTAGTQRLEAAGYKVSALNRVDLTFFKNACASGLIAPDTLEEITTYFASQKDWAVRYLMRDAALFAVGGLDKKSLERMKVFFEQDPWKLRMTHQQFFDGVRVELAGR